MVDFNNFNDTDGADSINIADPTTPTQKAAVDSSSRLSVAINNIPSVSQSGTWTTGRTWVLASGTDSIASVQSGAWTVQPGNTANTTPWLFTLASEGSVAAGTAGTKSVLTGMIYNTATPAPTNGQQLALQSNSEGRLKVDANFSVLGGQLVPTITNKFRVRYSTTSATVGAAYSTIYTRSGTGLFFGFQTDFNSANVRLKLTIDGGQIFEITVSDVKLFQFNDTSTTRMQMGGFFATVGNTVDFSSKFPIPYTSSITIEMQRTDGTNHSMSQYMVFLTEDT